ncbi:hypothetical protein C8R44DRAFT_867507 [Mycena epipterygia]|nr:hypothetical protein C8R44DRAFT_867507 [Mycena epipterygia]
MAFSATLSKTSTQSERVKWSSEIFKRVKAIPDTHGTLIGEVWKLLPENLQVQLCPNHSSWQAFLYAFEALKDGEVTVPDTYVADEEAFASTGLVLKAVCFDLRLVILDLTTCFLEFEPLLHSSPQFWTKKQWIGVSEVPHTHRGFKIGLALEMPTHVLAWLSFDNLWNLRWHSIDEYTIIRKGRVPGFTPPLPTDFVDAQLRLIRAAERKHSALVAAGTVKQGRKTMQSKIQVTFKPSTKSGSVFELDVQTTCAQAVKQGKKEMKKLEAELKASDMEIKAAELEAEKVVSPGCIWVHA